MRIDLKISLTLALLAACGPSAEVAYPRAAPRGLIAEPDANHTAIRLSWLAAPGARAYRVYRSAQAFPVSTGKTRVPAEAPWRMSGMAAVVSGPTVEETGFYDTGVSAETRYYYRVTALLESGESEPSNVASAAPLRFNEAPRPTAPSIETTKNRQGSTLIKANDPNTTDDIVYRVTSLPANGTAKVSATGLTVYAPEAGFAGKDSFAVTVSDAFGGSGAVTIDVTVTNRPPAPFDADLRTYKNTPVGYLIDPHDPDVGETFSFDVTEEAAHGTVWVLGDGFVVYQPDANFTGSDRFSLSAIDSSGASRGLTLTVWVANRVPMPIAVPLVTALDTPGQTQVLAQDPDPAERLVYDVVELPAHGSATVSAGGLVTYTPQSGYLGADKLKLRVTDESGAAGFVEIPIQVVPLSTNPPLPPEVCEDDWTRVVITDIEPAAFTQLAQGTDVAFTVTLSYSTPVTQDIGVRLGGYGQAITTVAPGCGTVTLKGTAARVMSTFWVEPQPNFSLTAIQYPVTTSKYAVGAFTFVELPRGSLIRTPTFEFDTRIAFDLADDTGAWTSRISIDQIGGQAGYRTGFYPTLSPVNGMPLRLRGALACSDTFATYQLQAQRDTPEAAWAYYYLAFPANPPAIEVDNFLTWLPVTNTAVTQTVNLRPCAGATAVTFTTSAPWFSVEPTLATLLPYMDTPIEVTVNGAAVPTFHTAVTAALSVWPFAGEPFAPVTIPVSAVRHTIDLSGYERIGLAGSDDGSVMMALPWPFPFHGQSVTHVEVTANGTVNLTDTPCMNDWQNLFGPFSAYAPNHYGCAFLAPLWADHTFANHYAFGQSTPDVYARSVTGTPPYFELLFWDLQSRERFYTHNVIKVLLFADGRFSFEYPQVQAYGTESVGWWDEFGLSGPLTFAGAIESGEILYFGPVH